jgi:hypothetical protein
VSIHIDFNHHEGGFFSNFNKIITHLTHNEDVSKVTWNLKGQPFGAFAYNCEEVFSNLFECYDEGRDIKSKINISEFKQLQYTGKNAHNLYTGNSEWRNKLYNTYNKYIKPTKLLKDSINIIDNSFANKNTIKIGILKRNQLLRCEQNNNIMPDIEKYMSIISSMPGEKTCILSVDNMVDLTSFKNTKNLKVVYSTNIKRTEKDTDMEPHFLPGTIQDAIYYFIDVYMLSKCDYLIHPISNMATAALYFNPDLKSIYLQ